MGPASAHYATAGVKGWLHYFFTPHPGQRAWRYWKPPFLTWRGWAESWRFWRGKYEKPKWIAWRRRRGL